MLQHNDICGIFPRIKDRVKFIDSRTKLISSLNDQHVDISTITNNAFDSAVSQQNADSGLSVLSKTMEVNNIDETENPDPSTNSALPNDDDIDDKSILPTDYDGPRLTTRMKQYIEENNLSKFNAHTKIRGELLSILYDDITNTYNLL